MKSAKKAAPARTPGNRAPGKPSTSEKLEQWCLQQRTWIILAIVITSLVFRVVYYRQCSQTHFINEHTNPESDMSFFNIGAEKVAGGDLLSNTVDHPEHKWMEWVSERYFQAHPDKLAQIRAKIGNDTLKNNPTKMLWDQWYGGKTFQQEPLYSYFIALIYTVFGKDVHWVFIFQMLIGILTNVLIFIVTCRYFGNLAATIAGFLAVFCGPLMFYEMVLLRSTIAVFLGILLVYLAGMALGKNRFYLWFLTGMVTGLGLMVHVFYIFFLFGLVLIVPFVYRKNMKTGLSFTAAVIAGLILTVSPLIYRNIRVGAPPLNLASTSAISFVTMNNESFKSFIGWNMNTKHLADILGEADGHLFKSIVLTLKTHPSAGSYLSQEWDKFHATFSWYEVPNNVNFYLYRDYMPVLFFAFISFLLISPLALAGMFLGIYKKISAWPLYLMFLVYMFPMLAFMVLARYRIILVPVLLPFAALTLIELLGSWKGAKNYLLLAAVLILGYWASTTGSEQVSRVTRNDYANIWSVHYGKPVKQQLAQQKWDSVAMSLGDFLSRYEPGNIASSKPSSRCSDKNESDLFNYFSTMHSNLSVLYKNKGDTINAGVQQEIAGKLKNIADR